ncbi:MAG TPA: hypothetical protein VK196_11795 [Magnetospirillum sp.]|nr:hypothetical protein [Magnetospirillum sp.]
MTSLSTITLSPMLPWPWLAALAALALAAWGLALARRARGAWLRLLPLAMVLLALLDPRLVTEDRRPLPEIALVVVDDSASQRIGDRRAQTEGALAELRAKLARLPNLEVRVERVGGAGDDGTRLFAAADRALADVPRRRLAGVVMITDGRVHDVPADKGKELGAPLHALITGKRGERDRRLVLTRTPGYAMVGKTATIGLKVEDPGFAGGVVVDIRVDGRPYLNAPFPANRESTVEIPVSHAGTTVVELAAEAGPGELSLDNNRAALGLSGVRDRLKVLLVSGEPHAGERAWRNLLKADPSVDLVHFTILRPPEKDDRTPIRELALITFPVRELFEEKLNDFDLVVFDRYRRRGVLAGAYYQALVDYVKRGGALLAAAGPEFAEAGGLYDSPLGAALPAEPTGTLVDQPFVPRVTDLGRRHPVTAALPGDGQWGEWMRQVAVVQHRGSVILAGADNRPLLILDKVGEGRVAQVLSDTIWLWARGFEGGGPHDELLRRLAHWLMKEPELEEESLTADIKGDRLEVVRRSLAPPPETVSVTAPDGSTRALTLEDHPDGRATAAMTIGLPGLWRVEDGEHTAIAASGTLSPLEDAELTATAEVLAPVAQNAGGSVRFLADGGVPDFRRVTDAHAAVGRDWAGLVARGDHTVTGVREVSLLPALALLALVVGGLLAAWRREGR